MYRLFAVLVHRGSGYGDHYHAYVHDEEQVGRWQDPVSLAAVFQINSQLQFMCDSWSGKGTGRLACGCVRSDRLLGARFPCGSMGGIAADSLADGLARAH